MTEPAAISLDSRQISPQRIQWIMDVGESTVADWLSDEDGNGRKRAPLITHFRRGRIIRVSPEALLQFIMRDTVRARTSGLPVPISPGDISPEVWQRLERMMMDQLQGRLERAA